MKQSLVVLKTATSSSQLGSSLYACFPQLLFKGQSSTLLVLQLAPFQHSLSHTLAIPCLAPKPLCNNVLLLWSSVCAAKRPVLPILMNRERSAINSVLHDHDNTQAPSPRSTRWCKERQSQNPHTHSIEVHDSQNTLQSTCSGRARIPRHHTVNVSNHNHNTSQQKEVVQIPFYPQPQI